MGLCPLDNLGFFRVLTSMGQGEDKFTPSGVPHFGDAKFSNHPQQLLMSCVI